MGRMREFSIRPFNGWYDASVWCYANAKGPCSVLTPWKIWEWTMGQGWVFGGNNLVYWGQWGQRRESGNDYPL